MTVPLDAFAERLAHLMREGRIPSSRLGTKMRERLRPLFEVSAISEERFGAGSHVVIRDADAVARFVRKEFPSGMAPIVPESTPPRARSVLLARDAKRAKRGNAIPIFLRAFRPATLRRHSDQLDIYAMTRTAGVAAIVVDQSCAWRFEGRIALAENLEVFLNVERIDDTIDLVLFTGGRLSSLVRCWLASAAMKGTTYVHLGDYDPVGLDEYLKLEKVCPGQTTLHIPPDLDERLRRFGKPALLADSIAVLDRLRRESNPHVTTIVRALDQHGCGLEQEALLLPI